MKNRRSAIIARRESEGEARRPPLRSNDSPMSPAEPNGTTAQPARSIEVSQSPPMGFTAVNTRQSMPAEPERRLPDPPRASPPTEDVFPGSSTGNVAYINGRSVKGASPTEKAEMMKKFLGPGEREPAADAEPARRASLSIPQTQTIFTTSETRPRSGSTEQLTNSLSKHTSTVAIPNTPASLMPQAKAQVPERDDGGPFKTEMVVRMESMRRGERVMPPCDRCRRLHMDCLKNLTACMGCTKKHAKCSWKDVRPDELEGLERLSDLEPHHPGSERDTAPTTPLSTVAEISRVIEDRRQSEHNTLIHLDEKDRAGDIVMQDHSSKEHTPNPPPIPPAPAPPQLAPHPIPMPPALPAAPHLPPKPDSPPRPTSTGRFDVRPPPLGLHMADASNRRVSPPRPLPMYPTYAQKEAMRAYHNHAYDENDEGDRLQALAAQVYRSASQSAKPQESS